jgi:predicted esterase
MDERHIEVQRTARYHLLGRAAPTVDALWVVCHGYAQLARYFLRSFHPIAGPDRFIVAPEALNRYYFESAPGVHAADARVAATWMTREDRDHEILDYCAYLDALLAMLHAELDDAGSAVRSTVAFGFSQGAQTVSRWVARHGDGIDHVVLWGSGLAHELTPRDLPASTRLTIVTGDADAAFPAAAARRVVEECRNAGRDARMLRHSGGHRVTADALLRLVRTGGASGPGD